MNSLLPAMEMRLSRNQLLTKQQVQERIGVSASTLQKLVRTRNFPEPLRIGKYITWSEAAVERWLSIQLEPQIAWEPKKKTLTK